MIEMPKTVKIGYQTLRIENYAPQDHRTREYRGQIFWDEGCIRISGNLDNRTAAQTLIHEVLHGIWDMFGLPRDNETKEMPGLLSEERCVEALARGLATAIRDNPDVFHWAIDALVGDDIPYGEAGP